MNSSMIHSRGKGKKHHYTDNIGCILIILLLIGLFVVCSDEGKVRKVLKVEPLPDGSGHFFNLSK